MRLTTRGRYAVTAMVDLAIHCDQGAMPLPEIARRQGISLSYLEQLFTRLRRKGLVESRRGPGGGYSLSASPEDISIAEIIDAIEEPIDATQCGGSMDCQGHERCLPHHLWAALNGQIRSFLGNITLATVAGNPHVQQVAVRQNRRAVVFSAQS